MYFVVLVIVFLLNISPADATSFVLSNVPSTAEALEPLTVEATFSGSKSSVAKKTYYIRAAFYTDGSNRYFGLTENNAGTWVRNPDLISDYYQITTNEEGSWSGKLRVKADIEDEAFKGAGSYLLKLGRFTQTGSSVTEWSNAVPIQLHYIPPATPTPAPSPTAAPTPNPTPTPPPTSPPTAAPTASPQPSPTLKPKASPTVSPLTASPAASFIYDYGWETATFSGTVAGITSSYPRALEPNRGVPVIIGLGGILILAGALSLGWRLLKEESEATERAE